MIEGEDAGAACRLIAINPTLRSQAEQMLPVLLAAKVPANDTEVLRILIRHAPTYALTAKSDGEWAEMFGVYLDVLGDFSVHALEDAFVRWNRGEDMKDPHMGQFFPKPAQLVHLATKAKREVWMAAYRAQKALDGVERAAAPKPTVEERKAVGEQLAELANGLTIKALPDAMKPRLSPHQVAERLRNLGEEEDVGIVL